MTLSSSLAHIFQYMKVIYMTITTFHIISRYTEWTYRGQWIVWYQKILSQLPLSIDISFPPSLKPEECCKHWFCGVLWLDAVSTSAKSSGRELQDPWRWNKCIKMGVLCCFSKLGYIPLLTICVQVTWTLLPHPTPPKPNIEKVARLHARFSTR
jgi:hypothetical protein